MAACNLLKNNVIRVLKSDIFKQPCPKNPLSDFLLKQSYVQQRGCKFQLSWLKHVLKVPEYSEDQLPVPVNVWQNCVLMSGFRPVGPLSVSHMH